MRAIKLIGLPPLDEADLGNRLATLIPFFDGELLAAILSWMGRELTDFPGGRLAQRPLCTGSDQI
jgi:hypothetical protein